MMPPIKKVGAGLIMDFSTIIATINDAQNIAIISHKNMDGDAIGSSLGLMLALKKIGKDVITYIEEEIPQRFDFWNNREDVVQYDSNKDYSVHDLLIVVDVADKGLLGKRAKMLEQIPNSIAIDHHAIHYDYSRISYVQKDAAAVGELIYKLIIEMNIALDLEIATCLYVAISTDTGRFKFNNTTKATHQIAGELISYGIKTSEISNKIFDESTKQRTKLIAKTIDTLETFEDGKIAFMSITRDMMKSVGAKDEDQEGIIDYVINIYGVEVGVLIKQKQDGDLRASLRSKSYVDVSKVANRFGGGGHKMAAGCSFDGDINEFKERLTEYIRREIK